MAVDLHTHSTSSDGSESPSALVEMAVRLELSVLALTDHDILEGIEDVAHIAFTGRDVVRRELVGKIVDAYEAAPKRGERHG